MKLGFLGAAKTCLEQRTAAPRNETAVRIFAAALDKLRASLNCLQHVVEVMGHPGGELAQSLHPLRLN